MKNTHIITSDHLRSFIFGVEDSLVSTVGLVSGIAVAGVSRPTILLTGMVLVFVEAFSMSVGSLLSDNSAKEFERKEAVPLGASALSAVVMFLSYFFSGFVILAPYVFLDGSRAMPVSMALSLVSLFALGVAAGHVTSTPRIRKGLTMALVGGSAILIGSAVGAIAHAL